MYNIAIDGPCASGKTEVAKLLSSILNILAVDTGSLYRALTLFCLEKNVDVKSSDQVIQATKDIDVHLDKDDVYLEGVCVTDKIRVSDVNVNVATVAKIPEVREKVLGLQRKIAASQSTVMQGRDITSVVLPNAELKIYLTASLEERARRRHNDLCQKGENMSFKEVKESIKKETRQILRELCRRLLKQKTQF